MLNVDILCTDPLHPVNAWLERWAASQAAGDLARVRIRRDWRDLSGGDFLFLVSCHQIIRKPVRDHYRYTLVLHASELPQGRGMSPQVWQVLEGRDRLVLTLLNAEDALDCGDIWQQRDIPLNGTELHDEINARLFDAELDLMDWALRHCDAERPRPQSGEPSFYRRRTPDDSRIDPQASLASQFELLRVADPARYPAWFEFRGQRYILSIRKDTR